MKLNSKRHYYLYAKGWYKRGDLFEDLASIHSRWCGVDVEHIRNTDIISALSDEAYKHINTESKFRKFIDWVLNPFFGEDGEKEIVVAYALIRILFEAEMIDIDGYLGDPDETILPLAVAVDE